ncbi:ribonuclease H-like domain-containing protein [Tanacetum coccineum]
MPNDDERVDPNMNSDNKSQSGSGHSSVSGRDVNTADFPDNSGNDANSSEDIFATQNEKLTTLEDNIFLRLNKNSEPKSFYEASKFSHWTNAMNDEMDALLRNDTLEIVDLHKDKKAIGSKYIFKIKFKSSGEIDRYKARLVAQGFGQKEGIDYEETFSSVVKMVTVRCLLNITVFNSWPVFQLDVNNAFLYGDFNETMYMKPPEGYFPSGNKVCRIKKSLYGLKQAPRQCNVKLTSALIKNGFSQSNNVVDTDKGICLNQRNYVLDQLSYYGMLACKPAKTPLMSKLIISNKASDIDHILDNIADYQKLMGKLIYLTNTRLDISYDVHCLSRFMHSPLKSHLKIAYKILRYLKSCPGLSIHIIKSSSMNLKAFSDADWAKCVVTRKSVTGYYVFLNGSLVS